MAMHATAGATTPPRTQGQLRAHSMQAKKATHPPRVDELGDYQIDLTINLYVDNQAKVRALPERRCRLPN